MTARPAWGPSTARPKLRPRSWKPNPRPSWRRRSHRQRHRQPQGRELRRMPLRIRPNHLLRVQRESRVPAGIARNGRQPRGPVRAPHRPERRQHLSLPRRVYHRETPYYKGYSSAGSDSSFTTAGAAPSVSTEAAIRRIKRPGHLNAKVDPNGSQVTECRFEYATSRSRRRRLRMEVLRSAPGSGQSFVSVSAPVTLLAPTPPTYFRIVATTHRRRQRQRPHV